MFKWVRMFFWKREMEHQAKWFDNNEPAQARFEENEDWLEELEDRIIKLEEHSHPPKPLCCFEDYEELLNRIKRLEDASK